MAYVQPSGEVHIFECALTPDYSHTFWFETAQGQANYFYSFYQGVRLSKQSYTRITGKTMRVDVPIGDMQQYNYMVWRDTAHGGKWYYAFITNYEYVAEKTTQIWFELDVIQTYMFDWELKECFIARQHAETDEIGENTQPEPIQPGEMVPGPPIRLQSIDNFYIMIVVGAQNETSAYSEYDARVYDGVPTGSTIRVYQASDTVGVRRFLTPSSDTAKNALINSIRGLYLVPAFLLSNISVPLGGTNLPNGFRSASVEASLQKPNGTESIGGYVPKNKKMYTYPFYYMDITANGGVSMPLRFEFFPDAICRFNLYGTIMRPVQVVCRPIGYGSIGQESVIEGLSVNTFPQGEWNTGGYAEWQAQNSIPQFANVVEGVIGSAITKKPRGAISAVVDAVMDDYRASYNQPSVRGTLTSGGANIVHGVQNFYAVIMHKRWERARTA